jgi:hypothetical protein
MYCLVYNTLENLLGYKIIHVFGLVLVFHIGFFENLLFLERVLFSIGHYLLGVVLDLRLE